MRRMGLGCLGFVVVLTIAPLAFMVFVSLKGNADFLTDIWGPPSPPRWDHYARAFVALRPYIWNTFLVCAVVVPGVVWMASLAAYALTRLRFPGRERIAGAILALLMVPSILTLIPTYAVVKSLGLVDTRWALVLPYLAGGQVLGVALGRTFFAGIDEELFEAMRLDGADDFAMYRHLALPLSLPTLATIAMMTTLGIYNDYIWPLVAVGDNALQTVSVGVTRFSGEFNTEYGPTLAGYGVASLPLLALFALGMRSFVRGVAAGATKG